MKKSTLLVVGFLSVSVAPIGACGQSETTTHSSSSMDQASAGSIKSDLGRSSDDTLEDLKTKIKDSYEEAQDALTETAERLRTAAPSGETAAAIAKEEFDKLFTVEYKVIDLDKTMSRGEMELTLQSLGRERWECFETFETTDRVRMLCRRHPKSYLKYLLRHF